MCMYKYRITLVNSLFSPLSKVEAVSLALVVSIIYMERERGGGRSSKTCCLPLNTVILNKRSYFSYPCFSPPYPPPLSSTSLCFVNTTTTFPSHGPVPRFPFPVSWQQNNTQNRPGCFCLSLSLCVTLL